MSSSSIFQLHIMEFLASISLLIKQIDLRERVKTAISSNRGCKQSRQLKTNWEQKEGTIVESSNYRSNSAIGAPFKEALSMGKITATNRSTICLRQGGGGGCSYFPKLHCRLGSQCCSYTGLGLGLRFRVRFIRNPVYPNIRLYVQSILRAVSARDWNSRSGMCANSGITENPV